MSQCWCNIGMTRYVLRDIERNYLPALNPRKLHNKSAAEPKIHQKMYRIYSLHYVRLKDLVKLCELREWDVTGYREVVLFMYRYWSCCFLTDTKEALENTLELNQQFAVSLPESEVIKAIRSAEKAWYAKNNPETNRIAQKQGYPGAGYNISNAKLIEWLDITEEEQTNLETIIGRRVKYDRNNQRRSEARRKAGSVPRNTFYPKQKDIARRRSGCVMRE